MVEHVVNYSGGKASWRAAKCVADEHGVQNLRLLFADVLIEADDCYRFLIEGAANVFEIRDSRLSLLYAEALALPPLKETEARGVALARLRRFTRVVIPDLIWIAEGRTPWQVFRDVRFIGNSRVDPCSRILKRDFLDKWMEANCDPANTIQYFGLDATEPHRFDSLVARRTGWTIKAPLIEHGIFKESILTDLNAASIKQSRTYDNGFPHDNCSNTCIKAGQSQWAKTLRDSPLTYDYAEQEEQQTLVHIGRSDIGVIRDRTGGITKRRSLREFRERIEAGDPAPRFDWGGCGCGI